MLYLNQYFEPPAIAYFAGSRRSLFFALAIALRYSTHSYLCIRVDWPTLLSAYHGRHALFTASVPLGTP